MTKYFDIVVNPNDETGFDFNSIVDMPAHQLDHIMFNKQTRYEFNDEKRIVTGVAIAANKWIYRFNQEVGEHYVRFTPKTIELMNLKNSKLNLFNKLNLNHDSEDIAKGVYLIANYIVSNTDPKYPNVPEAFSSQGIEDGSLIRSYQFENEEMWQRVKNGEFGGFSIEGLFEKQEVKIKTDIQMKKQTKSIWDIFKKDVSTVDKFASATTAEGVVVTFDGELVEGTPVFIETEGEQMPAPEGEHQITLEDGSVKVIVLDAAGLVVSVADVEVNEDETGVSKEEVADAMRSMMSEVNDRFTAIEAMNATLVTENAELKSEIESFKMSGKFGANPKVTDNKETRMSIADMIKNAKK